MSCEVGGHCAQAESGEGGEGEGVKAEGVKAAYASARAVTDPVL